MLSGPTSDSVVAWSSDGNYLVVRSDRPGSRGDGLWAMPVREGATSGDPTLLKADFRGDPISLTRAGTLLFEQSQQSDDLLVAPLNVEPGAPKQPPQSGAHDPRAFSRRPRWSNDGQWFLYETKRPTGPVISLRNIKTHVVTEIPFEFAYVWTFDVSPDGRQIVCRATDLENHEGIFLVDTSTGAVQQVVLWQENVVRQFVPQFSADGRSLTYVTGDYHGHGKYVARDLATGLERTIADLPNGLGLSLRRSPNDRYLLTWTETTAPARTALSVYDFVTHTSREVFHVDKTAGFTTEDGLQWMPDSGAIVANARGGAENARELWWIPVDGAPARRLDVGVSTVVDSGIAIDRDGRQIAFVAGDPLSSKATRPNVEYRVLERFLPEAKRR
jgi:Tol biopolymer transport system component